MPRSAALIRKQGHLVAVPEISITFIPWKICFSSLGTRNKKYFIPQRYPKGEGEGQVLHTLGAAFLTQL